jgi:hypothetical protein
MRGTILYGPGDVRFEKRDDPKIVKPTDAIIKISATCVCGSDVWPHRGVQKTTEPTPTISNLQNPPIEGFCFEDPLRTTPKNARLADVQCNLAGFKVMARNLQNLDPPKSKD